MKSQETFVNMKIQKRSESNVLSNAAQEVILEYDNLEGQKASGKQHPQTKAWVRLSGRATRRKNQSYAD